MLKLLSLTITYNEELDDYDFSGSIDRDGQVINKSFPAGEDRPLIVNAIINYLRHKFSRFNYKGFKTT